MKNSGARCPITVDRYNVLLAQWRQVEQQVVPQSLHHHLAFRVLAEAAYPDLAKVVTVHPICQEEPGRACVYQSKMRTLF